MSLSCEIADGRPARLAATPEVTASRLPQAPSTQWTHLHIQSGQLRCPVSRHGNRIDTTDRELNKSVLGTRMACPPLAPMATPRAAVDASSMRLLVAGRDIAWTGSVAGNCALGRVGAA